MKRVSVLGIPFLDTDMNGVFALLKDRIENKQKTFLVTANPEIVMRANADESYKNTIQQADYIIADGIGVVIASRIMKQPLPERVPGFDLVMRLLKLANEKHYKIYMLGAKEEVLQKAITKINEQYPNLHIVGSHNGFFDWEQNTIADEIAEKKPDMVFVALGLPRQENWIVQNIERFDQGLFIGVGGTFDGIAGTVPRAPEFWQKANLEWFYRLMKQPSRIGRMMVLPQFLLKILAEKAKGK